MGDERWKEVEAVYLAALDEPDRAAFLRRACGDDTELIATVEQLLRQEPSTRSLFGGLGLADLATPMPPSYREPLPCGSQLGPYRIVGLIGSGGSSDVYKAADARLDRYVALKVFSNACVTEEFRMRFALESRTAASLNHPNIATVYEVGEADSPWYIAMEFVDGRTLRTVFSDNACTLTDRLGYLTQAAGALARAHAHGIAHCDLKPDNIMVTRDGLVKVLDFGLVRRAGLSDAATPRVEGTIGYMSPEQALGRPIDARSDVFSFGCMLFEAATNTIPFGGPSTSLWAEQLMNARPPRLDTLAAATPPALQALVDDCLVKDPGDRVVSMDEVHERLQNMLEPVRARVGPRTRAVAAIATLSIASVIYWQWPVPPAAGSVAVIPFASAPSTPEGVRLAEQFSEGVITALMLLPDLKVIARSSSFRFRGEALDAPRVARTLGVETLVTGRVVDDNGRLTIAAELVSGRDGTAIWGAEYTPSLDGVTDVQAQVAREIARRVRSELTPADQRRMDKTAHPSAEAYSLLLRGRYEMSLYTPESAQRAASYFEQALGIDAGYALANAELANAYRRLAGSGLLEPKEALRRGEQAALRAVAADDELPEAHTALAGIRRDEWQWADAQREYRRAIELSPSLAPARQAFAIGLTLIGDREAAVAEVTRARELDPVGLQGAIASAAVFYNIRRYDRALATLQEAASLDSLAPVLWAWVGIVTGGTGDFAGAIAAFERAIELGDTTAATRCYYAHALARAGRRGEALELLRALEREGVGVAPSFLAIAYTGLGDRERAIASLQAGYGARHPQLQYIAVEPYLDGLLDDPRFQRIVISMGLPLPRPS